MRSGDLQVVLASVKDEVLVIRRDGLVWSRVHLERLEPPQEIPSGCNIATHESEFDIAVHVLAYERPFRVKLT